MVGDEFSFDNDDKLKRRPIAQGLLRMVDAAADPLTICIDGEWGEGKTTFARKTLNHFKSNEYNVVYFDAFACDFQDDPLIALLAALTELESSAGASKATERTKDKIARLSVPLLKSGARIGIRALTANLIDTGKIEDELRSSVIDEAEGLAAAYVKDGIEAFSQREQSIAKLHGEIEKIAKTNGKKGLIFLIDELDRCRPNFAVEVIEKVKHVMSARNTHFFLIMNKSQMNGALKNVYGYTHDLDIYLEKFISHSISLPLKMPGDNGGDVVNTSFVYAKSESEVALKEVAADVGFVSSFIAYMCEKNSFNLRKIDRIIRRCLLIYLVLSERIRGGEFYSNTESFDTQDCFIPLASVLLEQGSGEIPEPTVITKALTRGLNHVGFPFAGNAFGNEMKTQSFQINDNVYSELNQRGILKAFQILSKAHHQFSGDAKDMLKAGTWGGEIAGELYRKFYNINLVVRTLE